jgi:hypothetical protein
MTLNEQIDAVHKEIYEYIYIYTYITHPQFSLLDTLIEYEWEMAPFED